jgi:putative protein-disulfide isomerase
MITPEPVAGQGTGALPPTLFYFSDPMCSWCWGFSPVMESIVRAFPRLPVSLIMGGLRASNTTPVTEVFRSEILQHWHDVQQRTGQPFRFDGALPAGFVYDTEPACRAVVSMVALQRSAAFAYLRALQRAFYVEQQDITQADVLVRHALDFGIEDAEFREQFDLVRTRERTRRHFAFAREIGVRGFPTVVLGDGRGYLLLTHGYRGFDELRPGIEHWLADASNPLH